MPRMSKEERLEEEAMEKKMRRRKQQIIEEAVQRELDKAEKKGDPESFVTKVKDGIYNPPKIYLPGDGMNPTYFMRIRIRFIDEVLGTCPADEEIYRKYIASNAPDAEAIEEEVARLGVDEVMDSKKTVFLKEDGTPVLSNHMIKGFFKNACGGLRNDKTSASGKLTSYVKYIDRDVFITPRFITMHLPKDNQKIGVCERPLRASTPQGERVALASAETVPSRTWMELDINMMLKPLVECVPDWLNYGLHNGIGQWHNGSKGRFIWEVINPITGELVPGCGNVIYLDDLKALDRVDWDYQLEPIECDLKADDKE